MVSIIKLTPNIQDGSLGTAAPFPKKQIGERDRLSARLIFLGEGASVHRLRRWWPSKKVSEENVAINTSQ